MNDLLKGDRDKIAIKNLVACSKTSQTICPTLALPGPVAQNARKL